RPAGEPPKETVRSGNPLPRERSSRPTGGFRRLGEASRSLIIDKNAAAPTGIAECHHTIERGRVGGPAPRISAPPPKPPSTLAPGWDAGPQRKFPTEIGLRRPKVGFCPPKSAFAD
ncbi:MAG: hypothetical protein ACE5KL_01175, partial [Alphaproteobacteria bacterium]